MMGWVETYNDQSPFEQEASVPSRRAEPWVIYSLPTWQGKQQKNKFTALLTEKLSQKNKSQTWAFNNEL